MVKKQNLFVKFLYFYGWTIPTILILIYIVSLWYSGIIGTEYLNA